LETELVSETVDPVDLLELLAQALLGLGGREQVFELADGFADLHFVAGVIAEGNTELSAHFAHLGNSEVVVLVHAPSGPTEGALQGE